MPLDSLTDFLDQHRLPDSYAATLQQWFVPLAKAVAEQQRRSGQTLVVGINGVQGSGKSTLASALAWLLKNEQGLSVIALSIDDFYLTKAQRRQLANSEHPLLATRGVPGTHDISLLLETLRLLQRAGTIAVPRFNKATDDRHSRDHWDSVVGPLNIVILDGWCLGVPAQEPASLIRPVNALEANEDAEGRWRRYVNRQLETHYGELHKRIDVWVMLKAPSFDSVYRWRLEQEQKLLSPLMSPAQIARFIQHYQRLSEHGLVSLPDRVNFLYELDSERNILRLLRPRAIDLEAGK